MAITIVPRDTFQKFNVTTGAGEYNLPERDVDALYGPGWPITPYPPPKDTVMPRQIDYPVAINYTLQPRTGYAGLMGIPQLMAAYRNVTEAAMPVNLIIRELSSFMPILRDKIKKQRVPDGHPFQWMTVSPDCTDPFNVWLSRYKKSAKVFAAPAFYKRRDGKGNIVAMEYIDGSTFFLIVNERGMLPEPGEVDPQVSKFLDQIKYRVNKGDMRNLNMEMPGLAQKYLKQQEKRVQDGKGMVVTTPAFTQVIKGIPFSFWDKNQVYFVPEPPAPSTDSPYGESYIERAWPWINIIAVLTAFELGHYRTGNMPEGFMALPSTMFPSLGKIAAYEREYNARMAESSQVQHARIRMAPQDTKWTQTKKPDFPKDLYTQARDNIVMSIGVPVSEIGQIPGKGLGGKGFESGENQKVSRQILAAEKSSLESAFNRVLLDSGVDDVEFYLDYPQEEMDPAVQQENLYNGFIHGINTMNDVLTAQDKTPIGDPKDKENIANMHLIVAGNTIFIVEKMKANESGMIAPASAQPGQDGGSPVGPEDAAKENAGAKGKQPVKNPKQVAQKIMQVLEESGGENVSTTFISIPALAKVECPDGVDPDEWEMGMEEEKEHDDITHGDPVLTGKIVMAHLKEDPKYYSHLKEVIKYNPNHQPGGDVKKIDITDHDGAMVAVFVPDKVSQQLRKIADGLGLPADAQMELAENMHITLAFLPDADQAKKQNADILQKIRETATSYAPIKGNIQGFGVFNGQDGKHVLYATLDCPDLPFIRTAICNGLDDAGIEYGKDHGFVPHITLAYFPDDYKLPEGFMVPDIETEIMGITLAIGESLVTIEFIQGGAKMGKNMVKVDWAEYFKHCGLCEEDSAYFGAPISREVKFDFPKGGHANDVEVVAMCPSGLPSKPALWKPSGGEKLSINERIGGPQYIREEAAYLLDQCLGFHLVPLAYVTESHDEEGAVIWFTEGAPMATNPKPADQYAPEWIEKAAIFDYIISNQDRPAILKNRLTHPDDPNRVVLIDNSFSFPEDPTMYCESVFCDLMDNKPLSDENLQAIKMCIGDVALWTDIKDLVGEKAANKAKGCAQRLLDDKMITSEAHASVKKNRKSK
jgi:2'-5' RNA ligase